MATDPTPETTPTRDEAPDALAKQVTAAASDMCEIARIANEWRNGPKQSLTAIREIRAVLASAPASGRVDAVKALVWAEVPEDAHCHTTWQSPGFGGFYVIEERHTGSFDMWLPEKPDATRLATLDAAKAAAQADYEQRIRSALSPAATPVSGAEPVAKRWLVEETLPGGSIVWSCFEHEHMARQMAKNKRKYGDEVVTLTPLYALAKPASTPAGGGVVPGLRAEIAHDGFSGDIIGRYVTREGKRGAVVQQDGTRVVHVYGEKWLPVETQIALSQSTSAGRVGE